MTAARIRDVHDTDEPVCPRCGHEIADAHELWRGPSASSPEVTVECDECAETLVVERDVHVTYSTRLTDADPSQPRSLYLERP